MSVNGSGITMYYEIFSNKIFINRDIILTKTDIVSDSDTILMAEMWARM